MGERKRKKEEREGKKKEKKKEEEEEDAFLSLVCQYACPISTISCTYIYVLHARAFTAASE